MPFKKILVALDGSQNSQIAAEYGFWLASNLDAQISGQHVVDPRLVDLFIEPEFAEELGFGRSVDTSEKVFHALRKIGTVILDLFATEAAGRGLKVTTFLDEGWIAEEIVKYTDKHDLLVIGHRGKTERKLPSWLVLGSVAERVTLNSSKPVLIAVQPVSHVTQILVAYDGSEPARGALLMAEQLAKNTDRKLKAITVVPEPDRKKETMLLKEQGESYLREYWSENVFSLREGAVAETLLDYAATSSSLLVLGAYAFKEPDQNVLGSTTTKVIQQIKTSTLIYKPALAKLGTQKSANMQAAF